MSSKNFKYYRHMTNNIPIFLKFNFWRIFLGIWPNGGEGGLTAAAASWSKITMKTEKKVTAAIFGSH